jgi:hypothetical protein
VRTKLFLLESLQEFGIVDIGLAIDIVEHRSRFLNIHTKKLWVVPVSNDAHGPTFLNTPVENAYLQVLAMNIIKVTDLVLDQSANLAAIIHVAYAYFMSIVLHLNQIF